MRLLPVALLTLLAGLPAAAQDPDRKGPPAFVPLESTAAAAQLQSAAKAAREGRLADAVTLYQEIVDGALADRLAAADADVAEGKETLEQARERAHRELAVNPRLADDAARAALREAYRKRFEATAARLLGPALEGGDEGGLREAFARFPITAAGAKAGALLARSAWRRGDAEECLGILDRLLDLHPAGLPPGVDRADLLALRGAAAAATGDLDLLALVEKDAASLGPGARTAAGGGVPLGARLAECRRGAVPGPTGPRGPLRILWRWSPEPEERGGPPADDAPLPINQSELPPAADHLVAVAGGRVFWTDRYRVTALDLATGRPVARSRPLGPVLSVAPGVEHRGETFAPAADGRGVLAALDQPGPTAGRRRAGMLGNFDHDLRCLEARGGSGDTTHPEMSRRFQFHGKPLLVGDRVFVAATEATLPEARAAGDVRTHVLCFRRSDLEPLWDTFVAYGSGIHVSSVAPAGALAHRHGRLYLATHTGLHACLDARTGAALWAHRYRTPEMAVTFRLAPASDMTTAPVLWHESPPAFSGDLVAFAPRDSYYFHFLYQRPLVRAEPALGGAVAESEFTRPRRYDADMTTLWILPGPAGTFFQAGQSGGPEEAPLLLRFPDKDAKEGVGVLWRGALMEPTILGLPARTRDAVYAITEKALYRVAYPGRDGEVERLAEIPPFDAADPRPSPGNLVVLPDRVLSVANDGVICFGPR